MYIYCSQVIQNFRRGVHGHLVARHVVMVICLEREPAMNIVTTLIKLTLQNLNPATSATVSCSCERHFDLTFMSFLGDPEFSAWSLWSPCSQTCGDGEKTRVRSCIAYCHSLNQNELSNTNSCNEQDCKLLHFLLVNDKQPMN